MSKAFLIILLLATCAIAADPASVDTDIDESSPTDDPGELTFGDLFRRPAIRHATLSPTGELVAYFREEMLVVGKPGAGYSDLREFTDRFSIDDITWIGPNTIWVESSDPGRDRDLGTAIRIKVLDEGGFGVDVMRKHDNPGYISDPIAEDGDRIVLAVPEVKDEMVIANLYNINVFQALKSQKKMRANQIDTGSESFFYYQKNSAGEYTLGVRLNSGVPEIWRRLPGTDEWEHTWTADEDYTFLPWMLSDDSKTLWVLSDARTDRIAAMEFDLETREFGKILYQHDRVDVEGILMSKIEREPIGVVYIEQGLWGYAFFSEERNAEFERLEAHFPQQGLVLVGYSEQSNIRLVAASSTRERGSIHICDLASDTCEFVESTAPWMSGKRISETIALDIASTDGVVVEAFLTLPAESNDSIPLVALPHGGPIGISDDRYFSSEVQWLAHNGYAVLQVNYRGSSGYGEEFQDAGLRQWGRGIEDDIEAAVYKVLKDYPHIDGDRVGIFGASYGGYSAMMSVIRNPQLFKCAASFAGVMDLTLLFTQSAMHKTEYLRKVLVEYVGDPEVDYEEQVEHSPVYRYKDISRPVLLAHGVEDRIVDVEHTWRLRKMLQLTDNNPEFILLDNVGHGFKYIKEARQLYDPLVTFLDQHLKQVAKDPTMDE